MLKLSFKYKIYSGGLFRDNSIQVLPDFKTQKQEFWIWFHPNYQSDEKIAYLNDLYKWYDDELELPEIIQFGHMNKEELSIEIERIEQKLDFESLLYFYELIKSGEIEIIFNE